MSASYQVKVIRNSSVQYDCEAVWSWQLHEYKTACSSRTFFEQISSKLGGGSFDVSSSDFVSIESSDYVEESEFKPSNITLPLSVSEEIERKFLIVGGNVRWMFGKSEQEALADLQRLLVNNNINLQEFMKQLTDSA